MPVPQEEKMMKVFSAYDDAVSRNGVRGQSKASEKSPSGNHKVIKPVKEPRIKEPSDETIVSTKAQKKAQSQSNEDVPPIKSDIANNDPNDPVTKEKLKAAISGGMIKFNDSERGVLKDLIAE